MSVGTCPSSPHQATSLVPLPPHSRPAPKEPQFQAQGTSATQHWLGGGMLASVTSGGSQSPTEDDHTSLSAWSCPRSPLVPLALVSQHRFTSRSVPVWVVAH